MTNYPSFAHAAAAQNCQQSYIDWQLSKSERDWERLGEDADRWARRVGGQGYMRMEEGHCLALHVTTHRGQPPQFFCEIYERRPQVCRDLTRGRPHCQTELRAKARQVADLGGPLWGKEIVAKKL